MPYDKKWPDIDDAGQYLPARIIVDSYGNPVGFEGDTSYDFGLQLMQGLVRNHKSVQVIGHNEAVGATQVDLWDGGGVLYNWKPSATVVNLSSSRVEDVMTTGTGAWEVEVFGLDGAYAEISEVVELDGQNIKTTNASFIRIYKMVVRSAGSLGFNRGDIYCYTGAAVIGVPSVLTTIYGKILYDTVYTRGENATLMGVYTVPAGYTAYIKQSYFASKDATKTTEMWIYVRNFGEVFRVVHRSMQDSGSDLIDHQFISPGGAIPEKSDIRLASATGVTATDVAGMLEIVLVSNA